MTWQAVDEAGQVGASPVPGNEMSMLAALTHQVHRPTHPITTSSIVSTPSYSRFHAGIVPRMYPWMRSASSSKVLLVVRPPRTRGDAGLNARSPRASRSSQAADLVAAIPAGRRRGRRDRIADPSGAARPADDDHTRPLIHTPSVNPRSGLTRRGSCRYTSMSGEPATPCTNHHLILAQAASRASSSKSPPTPPCSR